jgi:ABC-type Mn2+/Zn2+ transport system permease subunit
VTAAALSLLDPLGYEFFQRGLVVAGVSGALCGLVGVYVVVRSMAYIGHGLSHAVFGGAAISAVMGVSYFLGAGLWGVLAALTIGRVAGRGVIGADAAIGVVTTASFAVGLAIQSRNSSVSRSLDTVLFGNVLGVFSRDVVAVLVAGTIVTALVLVFGRELEFVSFDRDVARVSGVAVECIDALLMLVLSVTVLVSVRVIGALLISAMLVLPAATARSLTSSIHRMLWMSPLLGATVGVVGMYLSWYLDIPSGAVITLVGTAAFATAWLTADLGRRRAAAVDDHAVVS